MNDTFYILLISIFLGVSTHITMVFIKCFLSSRRAYKSYPVHYKKGLFVDKNNKFVCTITPVYCDYKTDREYLGKTEVIK